MTSYLTRQTASSLLSSTRCLRSKAPAVCLLIRRRCIHQEPTIYQQQTVPTGGVSYRPLRLGPTAPFPVKAQKPFSVNEDPEKLDGMYRTLLGKDLELSEKVKWQAVTHKSFDHGWQPYNERLSFFGKRVALMHTSLHHLYIRPKSFGPPKTYTAPAPTEANSQLLKPFRHPDYHYLTYVNRKNVRETLSLNKLQMLAYNVGLPQVMRWKPAENADLIRSAQSEIAVDCLYAIIGAVALQKGGDVAGKLIRDRILSTMSIS